MIDLLSQIKEQLFDAPADIKSAFNDIVQYFDYQEIFWVKYKEGSEIKWYKYSAKDLSDAKRILEEWKRDYPDWIDYRTAEVVPEKYFIMTINGRLTPASVISESDCITKFKTEDVRKGLERTPRDAFGNRIIWKIIEGPFNSKKAALDKSLELREKK